MSGTSASSASTPADAMVRSKGKSRTGLYAVVAVVVVIIIIVGAGWAAGWFKTSTTAKANCNLPSSATLTGAGSTLVAPLMDAWAQQYTASTVNYASVGSGAGIAQITAKTVDFGASDAPLNPTQRAAIPSPGVVTIPESAGAAVPIYNLPTVSATLKFTGLILAEIYLGTITNWNNSALQAINPGVVLPNSAILVVHRSDGSGTTFVWTSFLSAESVTWKSSVGFATSVNWPTGAGSKGNSGVTTTVKGEIDAIGYVDINYALTNSVAFGAVQNPAGNYVVANVTNIASAIKDANPTLPAGTGDWYNVSVLNAPGAHDYPIATLTYLFVYKDVGAAYGSSYSTNKAENLVDFLSWILGPTQQQFGATLYYIPLATSIVTASLATIDSITYNGAGITVCVPSG